MLRTLTHILLAGSLLLALAACGAEDGDLTPPDVTFDGGVVSPAALLPTDIVSLSGTMSADATIDVATSSAAVAYNLVLPTATTWTCDVTGLVEGENIIYVTATDPVGNNRLLQISIVVDLTGPLMSIDQYQTPVLSGAQVVAGTVSELGSTVNVVVTDGVGTTVDTASATVDGTIWSASVNLGPGDDIYTVTATGTDLLNNSSLTPATQTIEVDNTTPAPSLSVAAPVLPVISSVFPVQFSGSVDPLCPTLTYNGIPVTITAGAWGPVDISTAVGGVNVVTFDACNGGSVLRTLLYNDISAPLPIDVSRQLTAGATTITIDFAEAMGSAVDIVNLVLVADTSGSPVTLINAQAPTSRSFTFTTGLGLSAGIYTATLESFDTALIADARGNVLVVPYSWKIKVQ